MSTAGNDIKLHVCGWRIIMASSRNLLHKFRLTHSVLTGVENALLHRMLSAVPELPGFDLVFGALLLAEHQHYDTLWNKRRKSINICGTETTTTGPVRLFAHRCRRQEGISLCVAV